MIYLDGGSYDRSPGVLGKYLWRTLDETRKRPPFVIDEIHPARPQEEQ